METTLQHRIDELERRVASRERRARWLLIANMTLIAMVIVSGFRENGVKDVIRARQVDVVDNSGNVAVSILSKENKGTIGVFYDSQLAGFLSANKDGGIVSCNSIGGDALMMMSFDETGNPVFGAHDYIGQPTMSLKREVLKLLRNGEVIWSAP